MIETLHQGDALDVLRTLPDASVDALVTDPPAGIAFMGKTWDHDHGGRVGWVAAFAAIFVECLRVLKPGAHGVVWALPRTSHWTATALEDAGFEIRDVITHHFGSGFPKSKNLAGEWQGWGTALKPATEHWLLVRKPLDGTVAANVLAHGTGALNVDGCRVALADGEVVLAGLADPANRRGIVGTAWQASGDAHKNQAAQRESLERTNALGRWPTNLVLTHALDCTETTCEPGCPVRELDAQSGDRQSGDRQSGDYRAMGYRGNGTKPMPAIEGDTGGASRFFPRFRYEAKPSREERNLGCRALPKKPINWSSGDANPGSFQSPNTDRSAQNAHPTVKPVALMRWLSRLVTPPGGLLLDPFMGSGTTGIAAREEGFDFIGIERDEGYFAIAQARIAAAGGYQRSLFAGGNVP